jgi:hypothetical protein
MTARLRAVLLALALLASPAQAVQFVLAGAADTVAVAPGQTFTVDLVLRTASPAFNAFDLDLHFEPGRLTNVPMSPLNSQRGALMTSACFTNSPFHLFTPAPDSVVCTMVILCNGVTVSGPGTLYRLRFTAGTTETWATLTFGPGTTFYNGGPQVDTLVTRPIVVKIGTPPPVLDAGGPRTPRGSALDPIAPNPGRGPRLLMAAFQLARADDARLDLLDAQGRRIAGLPRERYRAGAHRAELALPRLTPGRYTLVLRTGEGDTVTRPWVRSLAAA